MCSGHKSPCIAGSDHKSMLLVVTVSDCHYKQHRFMVASGNAWGFVAEAHAQSVAVSSGPDADEDQAFVNDLSGAWLLQHRLSCLLYTSDAADDLTRVDLGGRRII